MNTIAEKHGWRAIVFCAAMSVSAWAQVTEVGGTGRALDANLRHGSGGVNTSVAGSSPYGQDTITDITRTRGLSAFRGNAPGASLGNQLSVQSVDRPTSVFRRRSVGLTDVRSAPAAIYRPQSMVYNDAMTTVLRESDILRAAKDRELALPGRTDQRITGEVKDLYVQALADYKPLMPSATQAVDGNTLGLRSILDESQAGLFSREADSQDALFRGGEELFGLARSDDQEQLARQLREAEAENEDGMPEEFRPVNARVDERVAANVTERVGERLTGESTGELVERLRSPEEAGEEPLAAGAKPSAKAESLLPDKTEDVYVDLLRTMRERNAKPEPETPAAPEHPLRAATPAELQEAVQIDVNNVIVLKHLAGRANDAFNRYMREGETLLKEGKYYPAGRQFNLATTIRPRNPLARLGMCLATFGAGEWYTAAYHLDKAVQLFPGLLEARIDLTGRMDVKQVDRRLRELDAWIKEVNQDALLVFMAAYLSQSRGNYDAARQYAKILDEREKLPMAYKALARFILTGKTPAKSAEKILEKTSKDAPKTK